MVTDDSETDGRAYDDPPTENGYQTEHSDAQRYFAAHRERIYAFWRAEAAYQRRREERVSSHRVDKTLT